MESNNVVVSKLIQYLLAVATGLLTAVEAAIPFFIPCVIATVFDIWSAVGLSKRIHKKHPQHADGKFKSEYKNRVFYTLMVAFMLIILASYIDVLIFQGGSKAVSFAFGFFLFYQGWSVLENWSSENDKPFARALQRIMINKAERHLNVPLSDIMLNKEKDKNDGDIEI